MSRGQSTTTLTILFLVAAAALNSGWVGKVRDFVRGKIAGGNNASPFAQSHNPLDPITVGTGGDKAYDPSTGQSIYGTVREIFGVAQFYPDNGAIAPFPVTGHGLTGGVIQRPGVPNTYPYQVGAGTGLRLAG